MQSNDLYIDHVATPHTIPDSKNAVRSVYFQIAGHSVKLIVPTAIRIKDCLPAFTDFVEEQYPPERKANITFTLFLSPAPADDREKKLLSDISIIWGDRFRFEEAATGYITSVQGEYPDLEWKMYSTKDFKQSVIYAVEEELYSTSVLSWLLMVGYGQAIIKYNTLLLHASVVEKDGKGFAFLGKSGTGKSTHSQLWIQHIKGTTLLNDDNPAISITDTGKIKIYGTPWSGKTSCYRNAGVELAAIIRLKQASFNHLNWAEGKEALITLLPSTSSIRWNRQLFDRMINNLERIISQVAIGQLACLPNKEAALLSYEEIIKR